MHPEKTNTHRPPENKKTIFLVYGPLRTGGIETLILRIANFLASLGNRMILLCTPGGSLEHLIDKRVEIIYYKETTDLIPKIKATQKKENRDFTAKVISFDPISAARGLRIEGELKKFYKHVSHISGIFHPRAYFMTGERRDRIFINKLIARAIGAEQLFFMNEECRNTHAARWGIDLSKSKILAIPINDTTHKWKSSNSTAVRIISIGRLVDFKAYNLGAPEIIRACLDSSIDVTWDIFGSGPLHQEVEKSITLHGVQNKIRLMGEIDYSKLSDKVSEYDLFVGMGTAALEAAMSGVPTICATVDTTTRCYGYIHDLPYGNVGETQNTPPTLEIADLIKNYSTSTQVQRDNLSHKCRSTAEKYGMPQFSQEILNIEGGTPPSAPIKTLASLVYHCATESSVTKMIRRMAAKTRS